MAVAREKMRDPEKFKLLRRELKSYGLWRNLAGARTLGIVTTASCVLLSGSALWLMDAKRLPTAGLVCAAVMLLFWVVVVGNKKVLQSADRYKSQFFNSLTTL
jgi:hypothetical protein